MKRVLALLLMLLAFISVYAEEDEDAIPPEGLEVHFINMGRNDAILILCDGEAAFFDSGVYTRGQKCAQYLKENGINRLKYYVGTHAHTDHVGGASAIISAVPTDMILTNTESTIESILSCCEKKKERELINSMPVTLVSRGDSFRIGRALLECVGPDVTIRRGYKDVNENMNSLIFRLSYGEVSFMLMADTTAEVMTRMLDAEPGLFDATVLKTPHHDEGLGKTLADRFSCEYIVYSTSESNPPETRLITSARKKGLHVYITNSNHSGTVIFTTDGEEIYTETEYSLRENWRVEPAKLTINSGASKSIELKSIPSHVIDTFFYTTTDEAVAYPDPITGRVYAVAPGECDVIVTGFDNTQRRVHVTVK